MKGQRILTSAMALILLLALSLGPTPAVRAANITVDIADPNINPDGFCSLIEAIVNANDDAPTYADCPAGSGADVILLEAAGSYVLTAVDNNTDGPNGLPSITSEIAINGNGKTIERSSAAGIPAFRIFHVAVGGTLTLNELTVSNGLTGDYPGDRGGGIFNRGTAESTNSTFSGNHADWGGGICNEGGTLTLTQSTISDNSADWGGGIANGNGEVTLNDSTVSGNNSVSGGGIFNYQNATLTMTNTLVSDNSATGGGGIRNSESTATLINSTVSSNNSATTNGGGIVNTGEVTLLNSAVSNNNSGQDGGGISNNGTVTLTNSTITDNSARRGGGIENYGKVTLLNSTISGNSADSQPGGGIRNAAGAEVTLINSTVSHNSAGFGGVGIDNHSATVRLTNTIVADQRSGSDCGGDPVTSNGHNLDSDGTCNLTATGDMANTNPLLSPLQDNGGPTETHALLPGSPAIDAGDDSACPATDQRGESRPADGDGDGITICDMGAYEVQPVLLEVSIDIKVGIESNNIYCHRGEPVGRGLIDVAILTTDDFDATTVDHTTVTFEGASEVHFDRLTGELRRHELDVDRDGDMDLLFHFRVGDTTLTCDATEATLIGRTFDGEVIRGTDAVWMIDRGRD